MLIYDGSSWTGRLVWLYSSGGSPGAASTTLLRSASSSLGTGGLCKLSLSECLCLLLRTSHPIIKAIRTTIAAPTPIPVFAPIDRPSEAVSEVDGDSVFVDVCVERAIVVPFVASANSASSVLCHITITPSPYITEGFAGVAYVLDDTGKSQLPGPFSVGSI
jgi:hypothetical protein